MDAAIGNRPVSQADESDRLACEQRLAAITLELAFRRSTAGQAQSLRRERMVLECRLARKGKHDRHRRAATILLTLVDELNRIEHEYVSGKLNPNEFADRCEAVWKAT